MTVGITDQFNAVYRAWAPQVFNHFRRMSWDCEEASDLTAEVFRVAWTRQAELREQSKIGAWLWAIARRTAANRARSEDRRRVREQDAAIANADTGARESSRQRRADSNRQLG